MSHKLWVIDIQRYTKVFKHWFTVDSEFLFSENRFSELDWARSRNFWKNEVIRIIWELSFEVLLYMYIYPGSDCYVWAYIQNVKKKCKIEIKFLHHQPHCLRSLAPSGGVFSLYFVFWHLSIFRINLNRIRVLKLYYLVTWDFEIRVIEETFLCGHYLWHI